MYIGRFIVLGSGIGGYRVSSRSFPNRQMTQPDTTTIHVKPSGEAQATDNPYTAYPCARAIDGRAVLGNGTHVDPIAEKLALGYPARDALAHVLLALDYEKDDYDTPRIAGIIGPDEAHVGIVRHDALVVQAVDDPTILATYELDTPERHALEATTAEGAAREVFDLDFDRPICAAGATVSADGVDLAFVNGSDEPQS